MTKLIEQEASVLDNAEESIRILKKKVKSSAAICKAFAAVFKKKFHLHHG
uniref:Uncharacterized protein n=1 Tax=Bracon brevicornis TaxID=1563983 RepID=A0A6V7HUH3_9HYME